MVCGVYVVLWLVTDQSRVQLLNMEKRRLKGVVRCTLVGQLVGCGISSNSSEKG